MSTAFHPAESLPLIPGERDPVAADLLRDRARRAVFEYFLKHGVKTDDDLHAFIKEFLGYHIPRSSICPNHCAPFDFVADQFFERVKTVIGFANRTGGKTVNTAMLNVVEALLKPGVEIMSAGAIRSQADRGYDYVTQMLFGEPLITELLVSSLKSETQFLNGSKLSITTGSWHGLNSPHPNKVRCIFGQCGVLMWDGTQKRIADVRPGDRVVSWNGKTFKPGHVSQAAYTGTRRTIRVCLSSGRTLTCTPDHPIPNAEGTSCRADRLVVGQALLGGPVSYLQDRTAQAPRKIPDRHVPEMLAISMAQSPPETSVRTLSPAPRGARPLEDRPLPFVLEGGKAGGKAIGKALPGVRRRHQSVFDALRSLLRSLSQNTASALCRLWGSTQAAGNPTLQEALAPSPLFAGSYGSDGAGARHGAQDHSEDFARRVADDGALEPLAPPLRTLGAVAAMDSGFCSPGTQGSHRSARSLLARSAAVQRTGSAETGRLGARGLAGHFCEDGSDPSVVYVTGIDPGPTVPVYDLTVDLHHTFIAEGVVVSNCDEIELMHWSLLQEALQMSVSHEKWKAGDCLTSTRKFSTGTMQRLLDESERRQIKTYTWCIFEILQPCTRQCKGDPQFGDCPAYAFKDKEGKEELMCGGKAHDLPPGGFYQIEDFVEKVRQLDRETWETQWLNLRPSGGSLVYGRYFNDEAPFLVPTAEAEKLLARAKEEHWQRVIGIDFGSNFYAGYFMRDPLSQIWYQYQEYWYAATQDLPLVGHAKNIKEQDSLGWSSRTVIFADPSGRQAIRDLEEYGIYALPANNDVYSGINHIKRLLMLKEPPAEPQPAGKLTFGLGLPGLRFFSRCARMRKEMSQLYVHPMGKEGQPLTDRILKRDDHAVDAGRYALFSFTTIGTGRYRVRKFRGVW
jgi:hypothetical protein